MEAKRIVTALVVCLMPVVLATGQDKSSDSLKSDLEAVKAELKSQQDRIERLSQEVTKLSEALKQKAPSSAVSPEPTPAVPRAAPVSTPAPTPAAAGVASPVVAEAANLRSHTVMKGETLSQIAKQYGVSVQEIEQLNRIGDAKKLQAGQTIKIPPSTAASPSPSPSPTPQGQ
jgi:LysM repeat protein